MNYGQKSLLIRTFACFAKFADLTGLAEFAGSADLTGLAVLAEFAGSADLPGLVGLREFAGSADEEIISVLLPERFGPLQLHCITLLRFALHCVALH